MISINGLTVAFGGFTLLDDINFHISENDKIGLVGKNGAGKSTILKLICGLQSPTSGKVAVPSGIKIGYLPQRALIQQDFPSSVMEVVLSGCLNRHRGMFRYAQSEKAKAAEELRRLGMADKIRESFQDLSGGQQQRVLLARALMATEKLLLLDEPAAGLDPGTSSQMYGIVEELNRQGITILMVTHDIHPVLNNADTVFHFSHKGFYQGKKDEYFATQMGRIFMKEAGHDHS